MFCKKWLFIGSLAFICQNNLAIAQLRVAQQNISNYAGGREAALQAVYYGQFEGRSISADIIIVQEFLSAAATTSFKNLINAAPGSPGDWEAAPFINGPDTDSAFFYRTSRASFLGMTLVSVGGVSPNHPRNVQRYDFRPIGYSAGAATLACYSTHMKSGSSSEDQARRLVEAQIIRNNAESLPAGWQFLVSGDFNIQSSSQAAYQELVGSQSNNLGRFFDPIKTPGSWNNNCSFRIVHTQDPIGAGGMDDRHDQILLSENLVDGQGFEYVGNPAIAYSTSTWNDLNHSYRAWGNDGNSCNNSLQVAGNTMVGPIIAQAIIDSANGAGHLPVFLDLLLPPEINADTVLDFGQVQLGASAELDLEVWNDGNLSLWSTDGIAALNYSLTSSAGFTAPAGSFTILADEDSNLHTIQMDTSSVGIKNGTVTILSNSPDDPNWIVSLTGQVIGEGCECAYGDVNCSGLVNLDDILCVLSGFANLASCPNGDIAPCQGNGFINLDDILAVLGAFAGQNLCPCQ